MREDDLRDKVLRALLTGSATAPEIAEALDTSETQVLPVLDQLRGDDVVECMAGDWSLSEEFRSSVEGRI
jgi:predicted transcriptional regulator